MVGEFVVWEMEGDTVMGAPVIVGNAVMGNWWHCLIVLKVLDWFVGLCGVDTSSSVD